MSHAASPFRTVLVTRPAHQAGSLMTALTLRGFTAIAAPALALKTLEAQIPARTYDALAFTSANGVAAFAALDRRRDIPVFAVGPATAAAARKARFEWILAGESGARALAGIMRDRLRPGACILYPSGREIAVDLAAEMDGSGIRVERVPVYEMDEAQALPEAAVTAMAAGCAALFHSSRSVAAFANLARRAGAPLAMTNAVIVSADPASPPPDGFRTVRHAPVAAGDDAVIDMLARLEAVKGDL